MSNATDVCQRGEDALEDVIGGSVAAAPFVPGFDDALVISE